MVNVPPSAFQSIPPLEPEFPAAREHLGTHARSEEDVLSYIAFPQQAEQFFERREQTFTASYSFKEVK